jgi:hypothetical protein
VPTPRGQKLVFQGVAFYVHDGKLSVIDCVVAMLNYADSLGLRTVQLPLLNFVRSDNMTLQACGDVINDVMEGCRSFRKQGWNSLQLVYLVIPGDDEIPDDAANEQQK